MLTIYVCQPQVPPKALRQDHGWLLVLETWLDTLVSASLDEGQERTLHLLNLHCLSSLPLQQVKEAALSKRRIKDGILAFLHSPSYLYIFSNSHGACLDF